MNTQLTYQPFPGLRPYSFQESKYYYGRDRQKHQLLKIIGESSFVAVVGSAGVGKTSFVNSVILPDLFQGYVAKGKNHWKIISFRPGKNPLGALATAIAGVEVVRSEETQKIDPNLSDRFEQILRNRNYGIIEILEQYKIVEKSNLLIYIDHLDDLLHQAYNNSDILIRDVRLFIKRLVEVVNQSAYSVTVITTLRTETAGHFSTFPELAEIINKNQYLLGGYESRDLISLFDKINRDGIIAFDSALIKHIREFYRSNPLILGEFQHAMKRTVDHWREKTGEGLITLDHLQAIGGLDNSLSYQLDNIYGYSTKADKAVSKLLFQAITETSLSDTSYAIPRTINEISTITGKSTDDIKKVVKYYADQSCGVIVRYDPQDITGRLEVLDYAYEKPEEVFAKQTEITIPQNFILEKWPRLNKWIKEEYLNSNIYKDIARDAERNDHPYEGEKLLATWKWYEEVKPHAGWANSYNKNFALVEDFILRSKNLSDRERERRETEELSRQQKLKRNRNIKLIFSLVAFILIVFAFIKTRDADEAVYKANEQQAIATEAETQAQKAKEEAAYEKRTAELSIRQAEIDRLMAQQALDSAEIASERAKRAKAEALAAQMKAQSLRAEANKLSRTVETRNRELTKAEEKIEESQVKEEYLSILEAARDNADEALKILSRASNDQQRREAARIASDGYSEFQKINRDKFRQIRDTTKGHTQKKLFSALTQAYQKIGGTRQLGEVTYGTAISKNVRSIDKSSASGEFMVGTNDNNSSIYKVTVSNALAQPNVIATARNMGKRIMGIRELTLSNSGEHFIISHLPIDQKRRYISKYDADGNIITSFEVSALIESIHPYGITDFILSDQDGKIYILNAASKDLNLRQVFAANEPLRSVDFYEPGNRLYVALPNKRVTVLNVSNGKANKVDDWQFADFDSEISAIKYIDSKKWLVVGTRTGEIYVYDIPSKSLLYRSLRKHTGNINCLILNDEETMLASGGRDKIMNVWNLQELFTHTVGHENSNLDYQPLEFDEGQSIRDAAFLNKDWIMVVYSTEGLSTGKGGASLLPLDFDIAGRELQKLVK